MKRIALLLPTLMLSALPVVASAHEHDVFTINGKSYTFIVGSLNEPVVVDDKTGLDLTITSGGHAAMSADGDMDSMTASTPVTGLETTLKVELQAGGQKKEMAIKPQYGKPGAYTATFFPTVETTYSYRLFGTIDGTPVDLTFTCVPDGTPKAADDTTAKTLSEKVTRTLHSGAFGCPLSKESLGFPEKSASVTEIRSAASSARSLAIAGLAIAVIGLAASMRRRRS